MLISYEITVNANCKIIALFFKLNNCKITLFALCANCNIIVLPVYA